MAVIKETTVLIATCSWLADNGWRLVSVKTPSRKDSLRVKAELTKRGVPLDDVEISGGRGPDVKATKRASEWKIECKGMGSRQNTRWSDFQRGVGEVVCLFDGRKGTRLGLALPDHQDFRRFVTRLSPPMRKSLGLWIFLYPRTAAGVMVVSPGQDVARSLHNR